MYAGYAKTCGNDFQCIYCSVWEGLMFAGHAKICVVLSWSSLMVGHKFFFPLFLIRQR